MKKETPTLIPQDIEAEQTLLGIIITVPKAWGIAQERIKASDLYRMAHQHIWGAFAYLAELGEPIDLLTVTDELKRSGQLENAGGPAYIVTLTDRIGTSWHVPMLCDRLLRVSAARNLYSMAADLQSQCFEVDNISEILSEASLRICQITCRREYNIPTMRDNVMDVLHAIDERKKNGGSAGLMTGFVGLDRITSGLQPADLIIIAGRPSMGKSSLAMCIAKNVAIGLKKAVAIFSLEMSRESCTQRLLGDMAHVNTRCIRDGGLGDVTYQNVVKAAGHLLHAPLHIDDTASLTATEIVARSRYLTTKHDIKLIVIDYLQFIRSENRKERHEEVGIITKKLKGLAKELGIPVILLSQLNRQCDSRPNKRPMLSDIRESGDVEQDADLICFIYRDEVYNKAEDNPNKGLAEVIIGKQRNGPTGTIILGFQEEFSSFCNLRV